MPPPPVINIQHLNKNFDQLVAVNDLTFQVLPGEIFGFLGPNGAGKTTTIRMMLDLLKPDSGKIEILGKEVSQNSIEIRKRCGYLPGSFSAYGNLTGKEFLFLCANLRGRPRYLDHGLLDRLAMSDKNLGQKIKFLSHGTLQKLGIVQALFHEPELMILDEPTNGLDPLIQEEFYQLLIEHQQNGATIFFSSHNLAEVERICQRLAIIRQAGIEKVDSIENLRKQLRKKLRVVLTEPVEDLLLPGTVPAGRHELTYDFIVTGELGPVLKRLSELPLSDVSLPEPGLEEIFIHYYKDHKDD